MAHSPPPTTQISTYFTLKGLVVKFSSEKGEILGKMVIFLGRDKAEIP